MKGFQKAGFTLIELIVVIAIVAILGALVGYQYHSNKSTTSTATPTPTAKATAIAQATATSSPTATAASGTCQSLYSADKLKNGYIADPVSGNVNIKLTDGTYMKGSTLIHLVDTFTACDTVNKDDAAILVTYNDGGSGQFYYVETLSPKGNSYAVTGWGILGDRVNMKSMSMANGIVTSNFLSQGPDDSAAEPTKDTTINYKIPTSGTSLVKQ